MSDSQNNTNQATGAQAEIPSDAELHVVIRYEPSGKTGYLPGRAGFATLEQIQAMNEAAKDTGYRYSSLTSILEALETCKASIEALRAYSGRGHRLSEFSERVIVIPPEDFNKNIVRALASIQEGK